MMFYQNTTEINQGIYRLSQAPTEHFEFNQFLLLSDKTCLIHTGKSEHFESLHQMAQKVLRGRGLDFIVFSHFESDECGAVNKWLEAYPGSKVVCNKVCNISLSDFLIRPAQIIEDGGVLDLGAMAIQLIETPHFPHGWDAHMWFEKQSRTLFTSDFCCHGGVSEPVISTDESSKIIAFYEKGGFLPYGSTTNKVLDKLSEVNFSSLAVMHGSTISGPSSRVVFDKVSEGLRLR